MMRLFNKMENIVTALEKKRRNRNGHLLDL